jgi:prephenate dehydrogenase
MRSPFSHIAIIGTGLIGGSIGLAVHERYPQVRVTGFDRPDIVREALRRKAIDVAARSLRDAVAFADLIILSAPVFAIRKMLPSVAAAFTIVWTGIRIWETDTVKRWTGRA